MGLLEAAFEITDATNCPLYKKGDNFTLSGTGLTPPKKKPACIFLATEISKLIIGRIDGESNEENPFSGTSFNCGGCSGLILFRHVSKKKYQTLQMQLLAAAKQKKEEQKISGTAGLLRKFPMFQSFGEENLKDIVSCLTMKEYEPGKLILHKGQPGKHLHIIVSGKVNVLDGHDNIITNLGKGEMFGEMSLLSGSPVSATIKTVDHVKALLLHNTDFSRVLLRHPFLQMAFSRILVQRLSDANIRSAGHPDSDIAGKLMEISPAELFQMFHENMKTGNFNLEMAGGPATVIFSRGEIIRTSYRGKTGIDAFYNILKERKGRFSFVSNILPEYEKEEPIGPFMKLMMEGLQRIDEENAAGI
ncbi:MAG: cyclic nucleotide-binding domain-containing protein [Desulfobulbaceae bacterium]|nr:cyclic nucleotide-binding domain-containing protein [Desulfobulbaceae bacterium]